MKILALTKDNFYAAWSVQEGIKATLRFMGHTIVDAPPCDCVLVCCPEHIPLELWENLPSPKLGWFCESTGRQDCDLTETYHRLRDKLDVAFFPARYDANQFEGRYLPFGVDTTMFLPMKGWNLRRHEKAFQGQLYQKRMDFLEAAKLNSCGVTILPATTDKSNPALRTMALRDAMSDIKIFVALPSLTRCYVTKIFEALACGCAVVYPRPTGEFESEMNLFSEGAPIFYYDENDPESLRRVLYQLADTNALSWALQNGPMEILRHHRLDQRLGEILSCVVIR